MTGFRGVEVSKPSSECWGKTTGRVEKAGCSRRGVSRSVLGCRTGVLPSGRGAEMSSVRVVVRDGGTRRCVGTGGNGRLASRDTDENGACGGVTLTLGVGPLLVGAGAGFIGVPNASPNWTAALGRLNLEDTQSGATGAVTAAGKDRNIVCWSRLEKTMVKVQMQGCAPTVVSKA